MPSDKDIILYPIISEKSVRLKEENKYVFKVDWKANCSEIKKAIEEKFKTKVNKVNIIKMPGKKKSLGRYSGKTSRWKKAIVTLKTGEKIKELENI
ncbi:MAG: 50S ribosomal protein L23 [Candidatus Atribacteria bacterium]|nr:50S ribosomal protein L23 [Candidatus Atribacteria bacterium]MCK4308489.1 50S ribosomal protein L23 [Candidatus Atribacteria bacterium]